jgi:hypothetical protein
MLAGYCYAVRHGMIVQLVTPYCVSHLQRHTVTLQVCTHLYLYNTQLIYASSMTRPGEAFGFANLLFLIIQTRSQKDAEQLYWFTSI